MPFRDLSGMSDYGSDYGGGGGSYDDDDREPGFGGGGRWGGMERTQDKAGRSASKKEKKDTSQSLVDQTKDFSSLTADLFADEEDDDDEDYYFDAKKKDRNRKEKDQDQKVPDFMFFDFRRGAEDFPKNCEIIDPARAEALLEKQTTAAIEAMKAKKKEDTKGGDEDDWAGWGDAAAAYDDKEELNQEELQDHLRDADFEILNDGSTALVMKPGYRLKLHLSELMEGGDAGREEREKNKKMKKKKKMKYVGIGSSYNSVSGGGAKASTGTGDDDFWTSWGKKKEYVNEYTITMDIKLPDKPPREGISLFQTALIHAKDNKKSGKVTLSKSEGECLINQAGGVGQFGTFGDTTVACVEPNCWKRVVISVKCGDIGDKKTTKGEMRTWVGINPGIVLKDDAIEGNGRFTIDPAGLFIFSSAQSSMMPGKISVRTIRVERTFANDEYVNSSRARDKISNVFMEERTKEVEQQREGLSLASLFPKPRPMWMAQAFYGFYGDAFVGNFLCVIIIACIFYIYYVFI